MVLSLVQIRHVLKRILTAGAVKRLNYDVTNLALVFGEDETGELVAQLPLGLVVDATGQFPWLN